MSISGFKIHFLFKWVGIAVGFTALYLLAFIYLIDKRPFVEWTMINVNSKELQADAHLLKMPDGKIFLIDAGDPEGELVPFLKKQKITDLDSILISHMHRDHYGAIPKILAAGIRVKEIRLNMPEYGQCQLEIPWGCDWTHIAEVLSAIEKKGVPILREKKGDIYYDKEGTKLEVLHAYDGIHTPIGKTDLNDMSVILRLTQGETRVLFTGDLNSRLGTYLAEKHCSEMKAHVLKVPHHGTESTAPNSFFDCVGAKLVMVSSPKSLWASERSQRMAQYFTKSNFPIYVSGIHGHVKVLLQGGKYKVKVR